MFRAHFMKPVKQGLTLIGLCLLGISSFATGKPMNVLFIAVDDLRPDLGCYGEANILSPNIDGLAASGLTFNSAYCQYATCQPSRQSLLTGLRPDSFDATPGITALPQLFKDNGYTTISLGKVYGQTAGDHLSEWDTRWKPSESSEGWITAEAAATREPVDGRYTDIPDDQVRDGKIAARAVQELKLHQDDSEPFFLAVGFRKPHLPFSAPKKYWDLYDHDAINLAANPLRPAGSSDHAYSWSELSNYNVPTDGVLPDLTDEEARTLIHGYYACVSFSDAQVGRVLDELQALGLADNTIVILWGDHGWHLGDQGVWGKHTTYERATHAPLILHVPGQTTAGRTSDALVEFVDIYPTLAELCGLSLPGHLEGSSFASLVERPDHEWKTGAFSQHTHWKGTLSDVPGYTVRTAQYRYTEWGPTNSPAAQELYDYTLIKEEVTNAVGDPAYASVLAEMMNILHAGWQAAVPNPDPVFSTNFILRVNARVGDHYGGTLAGTASDANYTDVLTYSNLTSSTWLNLETNGTLSGVPSASDVGINSWSVQVSDGNGGTDTATLQIEVEDTASHANLIPAIRDPYPTNTYTTADTAFAALQHDLVNVAFVGDSITFHWLDRGTAEWEKVFSSPGSLLYAADRGISGDRTENVLYRILSAAEGGKGDFDHPDFAPKVIALMIGVNNTFGTGGTNQEIADGIHEVITKLLIKEPQAHILLQSILPAGLDTPTKNIDQIQPVNAIISQFPFEPAFTGRVTYYDLYSHFVTDGDSTLQDTQYFRDNLHPNASGYTRWREKIVPVLLRMLAGSDDPVFPEKSIMGARAVAEVAYSGTLAGSAAGGFGELSYSKVSGPAWLNVETNGVLSGTPTGVDPGLNAFRVQATDENGASGTALLLILVEHTASSVLAAWETGNPGFPTVSEVSTDGALSIAGITISTGVEEGSTDGTYGTQDGASSNAVDGCFEAYSPTKDSSEIYQFTFSITNTGLSELELKTIHFDAFRTWGKAPKNWSLDYINGDLDETNGTNLGSGEFIQHSNNDPSALGGDYEDIDVDLAASLKSDLSLAAGENAVFELTLSVQTGTTKTYIDNLAVFGVRTSTFVDNDGDGMDDQWELDFFGSVTNDGTGDADMDGLDDLSEYLAGTDPTDPESVLRMDWFSPSTNNANEMVIQWRSVPGKSYRILCTDALGGTWTTYQSGIQATSDTAVAAVPTDASCSFFQVGVE